LVALFLGAIGIALSPIFVRLSDVGSTASAFYRTALAVPILMLVPLLMPGAKGGIALPRSGRELFVLLLAGLFFAGDLGFWHWSIGLTSVANATLFPNLAPIFVTFAAWYFYGEHITPRFLFGLFVAIAGAFLILGHSLQAEEGHIVGDLLAFAVALFYAGYLIVISRLRRRYSALTLMFWSSLGTALALLPVAILSGDKLLPTDLSGWGVLLALAWVSHVGGQGAIAFALAHLPVSFSSVGLLLQPALAAFFAYLVFGEQLGLSQLIGGVIILSGIYLAKRGSAPVPKPSVNT
jgi:drug/metabolite transporter (DMT)-like permease